MQICINLEYFSRIETTERTMTKHNSNFHPCTFSDHIHWQFEHKEFFKSAAFSSSAHIGSHGS